MASWTDKTTPTFTPYVAHQPVEAMVKVGMEKQRKYEEGYQKIQDSIDRVAGLDVVREVDKVHLQGKLNELGGKLKSVAAGDFSNFQLANSVANMAGNLIQDPEIQNAVISTQKYRQSVAEMQQARKDGKSSPVNEYIFNRDANKWLQGGQGETFDAEYTPYVDVNKEALEIFKQLHPSADKIDNAFNPDGSLNVAMIRTHMKGISPQQIQQALMVGLSPGARRQLEMNGQYKYAGATGEKLIEAVGLSSQQQLDALAKKRSQIENRLPTARSADKIAELKAQLQQVDSQVEAVNAAYTNMSQMILEDPSSHDSVRAQLETENFLHNFGNAFSYSEHYQTIENNPYTDHALRVAKIEQDHSLAIMRMNQAERHYQESLLFRKQAHRDTMRMEQLKLDAEADANKGFTGTPREIRGEDVKYPTYVETEAKIAKFEDSIKAAKRDYLKTTGKDELWYAEQYAEYLKNPAEVDGDIKLHFDELQNMSDANNAAKIMIADIDYMAEEEFSNQALLLQTAINAVPTSTIDTPSGVMEYTAEDIFNLSNSLGKYIEEELAVGFESPKIIYRDDLARKELSPKQYEFYNIIKKSGAMELFDTPSNLNEGERMVYGAFKQIQNEISEDYSQLLEDKNNFKEEEIKKRTALSQGMDYTIDTSKPGPRKELESFIASMIDIAEDPGGLAESPDFDISLAKSLLADPQLGGKIFVTDPTTFQDGMYRVSVWGKEGKTEFKVPIDIARQKFKGKFDASPENVFANKIDSQINMMNGNIKGSTALVSGPKQDTNPKNAFLKNNSFSNVRLYGVSANVTTNDGKNYFIKLNIYDPQSPEKQYHNIELEKKPISRDQILWSITNLNDEAIYQLLHNSPPTEEAMKLLEDTINKKTPKDNG